jgi:hypothetical protein
MRPSACGSWSLISSPNAGTHSNYLNGVAAISSNDVWAVGNYSGHLDNITKTLTEHWNGSQWSIIKSPSPSSSYNYLTGTAAISTNDVWAVGFTRGGGLNGTLIEHWDGSQWQIVQSPNSGLDASLLSVKAISSKNVWAVGSYYTGPTSTQWLVEHWNGQRWSVVPTPFPAGATNGGIDSITTTSATNVWMLGGYVSSSGSSFMTALHWNGSTWTVMSLPNVSTYVNYLRSIVALSAHDVWAVGDEIDNYNSLPHALIEHWNGTQWSVVQNARSSNVSEVLEGITAISTNSIWAVGVDSPGNNMSQMLIEHWNGTQWSIVQSPVDGNAAELRSTIHIPGSTSMWAVGEAANSVGTNQTLTTYYC